MPRGGARPNTGGSHGGGRPKELEKPVRFYVTLEQAQKSDLDLYASYVGISVSAAMREASDLLLAKRADVIREARKAEAVRRAVRLLGGGEEGNDE